MKYQAQEFNDGLREKINAAEADAQKLCEVLEANYKGLFSERKMEFDIAFDLEGDEIFAPPYSSSIAIGMFSEEDEVIHIIRIWECERSFFGLPVSMQIPGSKVTGVFMEETFEEIQEELMEVIQEFLLEE